MRTLLTAMISLAAGIVTAAAPTKIDALQLGGDADAGGHAITNALDVVSTAGQSLTGTAATAETALSLAQGAVTPSYQYETLLFGSQDSPGWFGLHGGAGIGDSFFYRISLGGSSSNLLWDAGTLDTSTLARASGGTCVVSAVRAANVVYSRTGIGSNAWPRTHIASGLEYYSYGAKGAGELLATAYQAGQLFPQGYYTNVARAAFTITWATNATWTVGAATNFLVRITGCGPAGPAGTAWVDWNQACDWIPTNNGLWSFSQSAGVGYACATNLIINRPIPVYNKPTAIHSPMVFLINNGSTTVDACHIEYVIQYDNGSAN